METKMHLLALKLGIANRKIKELQSRVEHLENILEQYQNEPQKWRQQDYTVASWETCPESMGH